MTFVHFERLIMTDKLYERESYLKECSATVLECRESMRRKEDASFYEIRLDRTIFFPEEGGQYADTGRLLADDNVIANVIDGSVIDGDIVYYIDNYLEEGVKVRCLLDWEKRYSRMQQHTGEHILTGVIHNNFGYNNVGFHLSDDDYVTLDLDGKLSEADLSRMEQEANRVIYDNLPVTDSYPNREELSDIDYRSKIDIEGQVRLITIGRDNPVDICACCAPHLKSTGEVGLIKIINAISYKGGVRLSILCGMRALNFFRDEHIIVSELMSMNSCRSYEITEQVRAKDEKIKLLRQEINTVKLQIIEDRLSEETAKYISGVSEGKEVPFLFFIDCDADSNSIRSIYNRIVATLSDNNITQYAGLFNGNDDTGYRFLFGSDVLDARLKIDIFKNELKGKCGGSDKMLQGSIKTDRLSIIAALF